MTINGWCRNNYHKDGKRRFGRLTNGFCCECLTNHIIDRPTNHTVNQTVQTSSTQLAEDKKKAALKSKITRLEQKIVDVEVDRDPLNSEIKHVRHKLQVLINSLHLSELKLLQQKQIKE